jgi:biotin carboxylase
LGWPIIIKPLDGVGSRGVELVASEEQLSGINWSTGPYLAEQYITGQVVSVDAFSFNGEHKLYAINEEFPLGSHGPKGSNPLIHRAHMIPANISDQALGHLNTLLPKVLDALDLKDGSSHTEFIIGADDVWLVECHTRVGGAFIPEMYQRCTGVDLLTLALAWPLGLVKEPPIPQWTHGACFQIFHPEPGKVEKITGLESCVDLPNIALVDLKIKPGDVIPPLSGASDNVGYVIAVAQTGADAFKACERAKNYVQIKVSGH